MSQSPEAGEEVSRTEAARSHARRFLPRPQFAARPRSGPRLGPPGGRSPPRRTAFYPAAFSGARGPLRSHGFLPQPLSPALGPRREGFRGPGGPGQGRSGTVVTRSPPPPTPHPPPPARGRVGRDTQISESSAREGREGAERDAKIHQECGGQLQLHRVWRVPRDSESRMWTERDLAHRECNMDDCRAVAGRRQRPVTVLRLLAKVKCSTCPSRLRYLIHSLVEDGILNGLIGAGKWEQGLAPSISCVSITRIRARFPPPRGARGTGEL